MLASVGFIPQEKYLKCFFSMTMPGCKRVCNRGHRNFGWPMLLHLPYSTDFTLSHYHLFSPLGNKKSARMSTTPMTRHWRMSCVSGYRRGTAAFTGQEYMILFNRQKRLSTKMQNTLKITICLQEFCNNIQ